MSEQVLRIGTRALPGLVLVASGCGGRGPELARLTDLSEVTAFVTASVTLSRARGGSGAATSWAASGWMYDGRTADVSLFDFLNHDLIWLRDNAVRVIVSIAGGSSNEYSQVASALRDSRAFDAVVAVEVNTARANNANRSVVFASDPLSAGKIVALVREQLPRDVPVIAKLSADVTDVSSVASACVKAGAEALALTQPLGALTVDPERLTVAPDTVGVPGSGLCGPAIAPVARRAVWQVRAAMIEGRIRTVPIIGVGGVGTGADALAMLAVGASGVQVGSALLHDPSAAERVARELAELLQRKGVERIDDVVGIAHRTAGQPRGQALR